MIFKKNKEKENVYYDIEGNEVYDASTRTFIMDIPTDVQPLLLECMDKRISIKGIANTRLGYDEVLMLIQKGVLMRVDDLEIWKIANSTFTPHLMELALEAAQKDIFYTNVEYVSRIDPRIFLLATRAARLNIDMTDKITPLTTIESFKKSIKRRLWLQARPGLYKQIDIQFATEDEMAANTIIHQQ